MPATVSAILLSLRLLAPVAVPVGANESLAVDATPPPPATAPATTPSPLAPASPAPSPTTRPATTQPISPQTPAIADPLTKLGRALAAALTLTGQLKPGADADSILDLADQAHQLMDSISDPARKLAAAEIQMRAEHALAQHAAADTATNPTDMLIASLRMQQLRSIAQQTRDIQTPGAKRIADYWQTAADLLSIQLTGDPLPVRQAAAIDALTKFIARHPANPTHLALSPQGEAIRWALLTLDLQAGRTDQAGEMIDELTGASAATTPRQRNILHQARRELAITGQPARLSVTTLAGDRWSAVQHRGQPSLVLFINHASEKANPLLASLRDQYKTLVARGLNVLTIDVADPPASIDQKQIPTPVARISDNSPILSRLRIHRLPTVILLDADARIEARSHTLAVADEAPVTQPADASATQPLAMPATQP